MFHVRYVTLSTGKFVELVLNVKKAQALESLHQDGNIQLLYKRKWGEWKGKIYY